MHRLLHVACFAGTLIALAGTANADQNIQCPFGEVNVEISDRLPRGWNLQPGLARLTDTKVERQRGPDLLQCIYQNAGIIEIESPRGEDCQATRFGFRCETRRGGGPGRPGGPGFPGGGFPGGGAQPPQVIAQGTLRLPQTATADLDRGQVGPRGGADIWIQAINPIERFLTPRNNAEIAVMATNQPDYNDCRRARKSANRVSLLQVMFGTWVCVETSEGNIGRMRINNVIGIFPITVDLEYTTWR